MRQPSCNVVVITLTVRRLLKVAVRPRFDHPPKISQVQRVKYKGKPKILKNDQGPLKREKNMFRTILKFWGRGPPDPQNVISPPGPGLMIFSSRRTASISIRLKSVRRAVSEKR